MSNHTEKKSGIFRKMLRGAAILAIVAVLVIGALSVGASNPKTITHVETQGLLSEPAAPSSAKNALGSSLTVSYEDGVAMSAAADAAMAYEETSYTNSASSGSAASVSPAIQTQQRKLVRTASLTIRTTAYESDLSGIQELVKSVDGYVEESWLTGDPKSNTLRRATLTLRIPSERLDSFLEGVSGFGRVTERNESATDMTVQYYDNETRLETLRQKMARLNELMAAAEDIGDLIELESAISDTQYEIDSYATRQRTIDNQVDYSTVTLTLREENAAQVATVTQVSLWDRITSGLKATITWLGDFLTNLLVFVVMMLPVLALIAVVVVVIVLIRKKHHGRKAEAIAALPQDNQNEENQSEDTIPEADEQK